MDAVTPLQPGEGIAALMVGAAGLVVIGALALAIPAQADDPWLLARLRALCAPVLGAPPTTETSAPAWAVERIGGDPARGAVIAGQVCGACHDGGPYRAAFAPELNGLPASYILKQLDAYADGTREWAIMNAVASALPDEDRRSAAQYYARLVPETGGRAGADTDPHAARLVRLGDPERGLPACESCHGAGGGGVDRQTPPLAGRNARDLAHALRMYRQEIRGGQDGRPMQWAASRLTDEEIEALATYWSRQPWVDQNAGGAD